MPLNLDEYASLVVLDSTELKRRCIKQETIDRIERIRALYSYWLQFPSKFDNEIVQYDVSMFKISKVRAYEDLHLTQFLLGNFQQASRDFMRWKINQDLEHDLQLARRNNDLRAVASIEKNRIMNNRTDKEDEIDLEYDKIIPQQFIPTDDPTVLGIEKMPALRETIKKLYAHYSKNKIEDAQYLEMEDDGDDE